MSLITTAIYKISIITSYKFFPFWIKIMGVPCNNNNNDDSNNNNNNNNNNSNDDTFAVG